MSRLTITAVALFALAIGAFVLNRSVDSTPGGGSLATQLLGAANAQEAGEIDTSTITEMQMGNPDAPVTVIEYASFTCPHCANFHAETFKKLKSDYIDSGEINFIYREVYFDRPGLWASAVARCGGPEKFFGIADLIYKGQSDWARASDPAAIVDGLRKIGRLAGIESETLEACLQDAQKLRTLVAWYEENAEEHGINSTPSFVINGETHRNMPYEEMQSLIEDAADS
jgi:protein-disulfide isomerase